MTNSGSRNGPIRVKPAHIGGGGYVRKALAGLRTVAVVFLALGGQMALAQDNSDVDWLQRQIDASRAEAESARDYARENRDRAKEWRKLAEDAQDQAKEHADNAEWRDGWIKDARYRHKQADRNDANADKYNAQAEEAEAEAKRLEKELAQLKTKLARRPVQDPEEVAGDSQALLGALSAAQNGLAQREQLDVAPAYGRQQVPSALAAAQGAVADRQDQMVRARVIDELRRRDRDHDDDDDDDGRHHSYPDDDRDQDSERVTDPGDDKGRREKEAGGRKDDRKHGDSGKRSKVTEFIDRGGRDASATGRHERGQLRESADATGLIPPYRAGSRIGVLERGQDSR